MSQLLIYQARPISLAQLEVPVALLQSHKILQSMAESDGGRFEGCRWLNYTDDTI